MTAPRTRWSDELLAHVVGNVLRWGVITAAVVTAAGVVLFLARHGGETPDFHAFRGEPTGLRSIHGVVAAAAGGEGRAVIQLGLLLLVATPIVRVALSLVGFARERDGRFVAITAVVLAILLFSFLAGRA